MRESSLDKYICIFVLLVFFYSFFVVGYSAVFESDLGHPVYPAWKKVLVGRDEVVAVEYPTAVLICPIIFLMFFGFIVFRRELRVVDRRWLRRHIGFFWCDVKKHFRDGLDEYRRFRGGKS